MDNGTRTVPGREDSCIICGLRPVPPYESPLMTADHASVKGTEGILSVLEELGIGSVPFSPLGRDFSPERLTTGRRSIRRTSVTSFQDSVKRIGRTTLAFVE
jgi:hypothetical protein